MYKRSQDYQQYMQSDLWKHKRARRLAIDNYRCQFCGCRGSGSNPLEVHHLKGYGNMGNEDVDKELVTLCRCCHAGVHRMMNRITDSATGRRGWKQ